jgi:hypothetical protein
MTMAMMSGLGNDRNDETVENLILDLVEWLARKGRSYQETIQAWRTFLSEASRVGGAN